MNCKDCKHWYKPKRQDQWNGCEVLPDHGFCGAVQAAKDYKDEDLPSVNSQSIAFTTAYEGSGALATRADFGCVQFEAKA